MSKGRPWQCPSSPPCASSGGAWWLRAAWYSQSEAQPLGAQPPPRGLELAASKVTHVKQIDVEMLGGAEVYATFVVVGAALSMLTSMPKVLSPKVLSPA